MRHGSLAELLDQHLDALHRCALICCAGRRADAEDLLHDAVLRACAHFAELREPGAAKAWLFTILARTNLNRLRSQRRRAELFSADLDESEFEAALAEWSAAPGPDDAADLALTRERLDAALAALDERLRLVLWLSDVEGFSQREVAEMLELPRGTVGSRLFRARRGLRGILAPDRGSVQRRTGGGLP